MAKISLAVQYRPKKFEEVVEQDAVKVILQEQIANKSFQHAYLFCGPAGTAKTTLARIFANEINKGAGLPIEVDAASNSGVENVRSIIEGARRKAIDASYKIYIIDECHQFSLASWQAMLKLLEEPPATAIFIMCTTDPQKIPQTILSRVQRYNLSKISLEGIISRLKYIIGQEKVANPEVEVSEEAIEYIAKLAEGGMRDAITMLDKCLSMDRKVTLEKVVSALGTVDYKVYFELLLNITGNMYSPAIKIVEDVYNGGKDLKLFMKNFEHFVLDVCKYKIYKDFKYINIPNLPEYKTSLDDEDYDNDIKVLNWAMKLNNQLKWDSNPRATIESSVLLYMEENLE